MRSSRTSCCRRQHFILKFVASSDKFQFNSSGISSSAKAFITREVLPTRRRPVRIVQHAPFLDLSRMPRSFSISFFRSIKSILELHSVGCETDSSELAVSQLVYHIQFASVNRHAYPSSHYPAAANVWGTGTLSPILEPLCKKRVEEHLKLSA